MALNSDIHFFDALKSSEDVVALVENRIYNTAVPYPDEELDKVAVPYIVIAHDGVTNGQGDKDYPNEGDEDIENVSVLVVASSRDKEALLARMVRSVLRSAFEGGEYADVLDYTFSAEAVQMDVYKPCVYQTLRYTLTTKNI